MNNAFFKIEEVSRKTGLTKRALRYYEDINLVNPTRTESGYRIYSEEDIAKIERIINLRDNFGFTLSEIKDILELQKQLEDILSGSEKDKGTIDKTIDRVNDQINLIDEKESSLERAKAKYKEILSKLMNLQDNLEEE